MINYNNIDMSRLQAIDKLKPFESTCLYTVYGMNHLHDFTTDYSYKLVELAMVCNFIMTK